MPFGFPPELAFSFAGIPKLVGFAVFSNLRIPNRHLGAEIDLAAGVVQRLVVESSKNKLPLVVANFDPNPHPFGYAGHLIRKFDLDVASRQRKRSIVSSG